MTKRMTRSTSLIAVLFGGSLFVLGVAAQSTRTRPEPPCPPAVKTPAPAAPRGAGVGAANGTGIGAANGTGIGGANGTGIGTATVGGSGQGRTIIAGPDMRELWVRTLSAVRSSPGSHLTSQTETVAGSELTAQASDPAAPAAAPTATTPLATEKVTRTYIKEMDGTCYYVTNDGSKKFVAAKKCEMY
ncbi:MAG: hypothetical protein ABJB40_10350 [Acidobacteriota bacterium]